ncbi:hypothetical protein [Nocardia concava]|uniref:hypothetical protein n=1 Tax=Nocardia concava TaxID=257281 RepID=UPI0012FC5AE8|nr:hypothetical protein [Nocardia concava]
MITVIATGVAGTMLVLGKGGRGRVLFWVAAFGSGMALQMAAGVLVGYASGFGEYTSPASGYWVFILLLLIAIAALVSALRDAVVAKRVAAPEPSGGAATRVAGVFLILSAAVDFGRSFVSLDDLGFLTIWKTGADGSIPWAAVQFVAALIVVLVVAIALLAGAGVRNPAVRTAGGAAAAFVVADAVSSLGFLFGVRGLAFWEYAGAGFLLVVLTLLLSFAATIAGLVAHLARPQLTAQPGAGYAPNPFAPMPAANPFAPANSAPNPFAHPTPTPNPFAPAAPAPNPFAPSAPNVEATVKIPPEPAAVRPPRMAKVYDGKDADGKPVVNRPAVEGNTRTAVLAYLESAPIVLAARSFEQDEFAPGDRDVPLTFRTDGTWVWAGAVAHYLNKHGLPPEAELVRHIADRGFRVGEVGKAAQDAAIRVITGS